ncbi:MAG: hypothetical protein II942_04145 [Alphaproteobacteria bacterium]|nr:hypothetical protein [Alphaproteobacteria bacterium]
MRGIRGANGQFFRDLVAQGVKPEVVPRESVLCAWDLSRYFHHKINRVLKALKKLYSSTATYDQNGQSKKLVVFCKPNHTRCFLAVPNDPEAKAAFKQEIMQNRSWRPRSEYLTQKQLQIKGLGEDAVRAVLRKLYETKATYEKDGVSHLVVECYASGPRKTVLGLDNTIEARALFARHLIEYKKERRALHRQKVCEGRGLKETLEESLVGHTNLTMDDVRNLGHGFYNRVSAVRRQMRKWNKAGHSFRRVMSWTIPGNRGECKVPWVQFCAWNREVRILQGIILLAEYCKSNDLDFQTEFAKDTRRIKENRGR